MSGQIDIETIQMLNCEVDINHEDHKEIAVKYLKEKGFIE
ncbi:hypothetical protein F3D3_1715 [Fusibacter sp. 3D3]|nr:hypothetical protein F3D3_1715 [Fusibacter sp. 3D3]